MEAVPAISPVVWSDLSQKPGCVLQPCTLGVQPSVGLKHPPHRPLLSPRSWPRPHMAAPRALCQPYCSVLLPHASCRDCAFPFLLASLLSFLGIQIDVPKGRREARVLPGAAGHSLLRLQLLPAVCVPSL